MAESTWMSTIAERRANFSEEAAVTIRRKMRAISLLAGLPILYILNSKSLLWSRGANDNCSCSSTDSSDDDEDPKKTVSDGEHIKQEDGHNNHDQMQCVICLYYVCEGEKYRVLGECSHGFHVDCIDAWLMQNSTCPLCRCSVAYTPAGKKKQQQLSSNENDDQEAYYEVVIASFLSFLDHLWTWFFNPLGLDGSCQEYHAYL